MFVLEKSDTDGFICEKIKNGLGFSMGVLELGRVCYMNHAHAIGRTFVQFEARQLKFEF